MFHSTCINCHSKNISDLMGNYSSYFLVKCQDCDLIFCKKIPEKEELVKHYNQYNRGNEISQITIKRYDELLKTFAPYRKTNKILDIGCGDGYFLERAKINGWEVYGTEYTDNAIKLCAQKGITIFQGSTHEIVNWEEFDVITSFEVIEHLNTGKIEFQKINSLLRINGVFYFTTPNFNSLSRILLKEKWKILEYPEHLTYYTPNTIDRVLKNSGFIKKSLKTTGFSKRKHQDLNTTEQKTEEILRGNIENSSILKRIKIFINFFLNLFKIGDTIKGYYIKK